MNYVLIRCYLLLLLTQTTPTTKDSIGNFHVANNKQTETKDRKEKKVYGETLKCYLFGFIFDIFIVVEYSGVRWDWNLGSDYKLSWLLLLLVVVDVVVVDVVVVVISTF